MARAEIFDYISQAAPDYNIIFTEEVFGIVQEGGGLNQVVHHGDDESEEVVTLGSGDAIAGFTFGWAGLTPANAGTIVDWYFDVAKANGKARSFGFVHPEDDHVYIVRFDMDITRGVNPLAEHHSLPNIKVRVMGKLTSVVNATKKWTQSVADNKEWHLEDIGGGDPGITTPTKVFFDRVIGTEGVIGSLAVEGWVMGDNDGLGYTTLYVRLTGDGDPDLQDDDWIEIG